MHAHVTTDLNVAPYIFRVSIMLICGTDFLGLVKYGLDPCPAVDFYIRGGEPLLLPPRPF